MDEAPAILAEGLVKTYGKTKALAGLDLVVPAGTVYGLLGPNGAGKTTAVRVFSTLLRPNRGRAQVLGHDVVTEAAQVRRMIGLTGQYAALDEYLTGRANLVMIGQLSRLTAGAARRRADEMLERFSLTEAAGRAVKTYSGGMRRRLDLAASLIGYPSVLFLDEPTTGLDPNARAMTWAIVRELADSGTTLLLTTQYLEEADAAGPPGGGDRRRHGDRRGHARPAQVLFGRRAPRGGAGRGHGCRGGDRRGQAVRRRQRPAGRGGAAAVGAGRGGRGPDHAGGARPRPGRGPGQRRDHAARVARRRVPVPHRPRQRPEARKTPRKTSATTREGSEAA